jgi:hypothetical protein
VFLTILFKLPDFRLKLLVFAFLLTELAFSLIGLALDDSMTGIHRNFVALIVVHYDLGVLEISFFFFVLRKKCINIYLQGSNDDVVPAFIVFRNRYQQLLFAVISPGEYVAYFFNRKAVILTCVDLTYLLFVEG